MSSGNALPVAEDLGARMSAIDDGWCRYLEAYGQGVPPALIDILRTQTNSLPGHLLPSEGRDHVLGREDVVEVNGTVKVEIYLFDPAAALLRVPLDPSLASDELRRLSHLHEAGGAEEDIDRAGLVRELLDRLQDAIDGSRRRSEPPVVNLGAFVHLYEPMSPSQYHDEDTLTCHICMEAMTTEPTEANNANAGETDTPVPEPAVTLNKCNHNFGVTCLSRWLSQSASPSCPICRTSLTDRHDTDDDDQRGNDEYITTAFGVHPSHFHQSEEFNFFDSLGYNEAAANSLIPVHRGFSEPALLFPQYAAGEHNAGGRTPHAVRQLNEEYHHESNPIYQQNHYQHPYTQNHEGEHDFASTYW